MKLYMIRHGMTKGNREHRYIGRTDEEILPEEAEKLQKLGQTLPTMDGIFASPYLRCRQSAAAILSGQSGNPCFIQKDKNVCSVIEEADKSRNCPIIIVEDFREMDFGEFEYKNYKELNGNEDYQRFIDSGGTIGFPGGESPEDFKKRCIQAFRGCMETAMEKGWERAGLVVHGGTIMAIMEAFGYPKKGYYDYQVKNGSGFVVSVEQEKDTPRLVETGRISI